MGNYCDPIRVISIDKTNGILVGKLLEYLVSMLRAKLLVFRNLIPREGRWSRDSKITQQNSHAMIRHPKH